MAKSATATLAHHARYKHQNTYSVRITNKKTHAEIGKESGIVGKKTAVAIKRRMVSNHKRGTYRVEAHNTTRGKAVKL